MPTSLRVDVLATMFAGASLLLATFIADIHQSRQAVGVPAKAWFQPAALRDQFDQTIHIELWDIDISKMEGWLLRLTFNASGHMAMTTSNAQLLWELAEWLDIHADNGAERDRAKLIAAKVIAGRDVQSVMKYWEACYVFFVTRREAAQSVSHQNNKLAWHQVYRQLERVKEAQFSSDVRKMFFGRRQQVEEYLLLQRMLKHSPEDMLTTEHQRYERLSRVLSR